ncbi:patatin-like phospholipase family protein [Agromyces sp. G08B096]|uniref:Patatin-like phospholipase family protein n=1 Tax=Agromyces sp. G08B096 TaxID=3156399 RepID=A0AAU7W9T0_9MICO
MDRTPSLPPRPQIDAAGRIPAGERALVLGGGGSTGNAWLIGVVAGLHAAGLDVTSADLTIGTSAGSTAAAQFAGASPADLFAATVAAVPPGRAGRPGSAGRVQAAADHIDRMTATVAAARDADDLRHRMCAAALDRPGSADAELQARWRATVAARLPRPDWPERAVLITAVDAERAEPVVFDRLSGVELADAVAASCSSGFAYRIGDRRYVDGGYRRNAENADLAAGYGRVLVLSPFGGRSFAPAEWGTDLAAQVDELRAQGSRVETVTPSPDAERLFGANAMDLSLRPDAARAGFAQGEALAGRLARFWA